MGHRSHQQCDWRTLEKDRREVDSGQTEVRVGPTQRIPNKTLTNSEPRLDAQVAMQSRTTKGHKPSQIAAESESKNASEPLHMEQKDWIEEMK